MTALLNLVPVLLPLLSQLPGDVSALIAWVQSIRTSAQQSSEWTPAMEIAFQQLLLTQASSPVEQPDPPKV